MATLPSWLGGYEPGQIFTMFNAARNAAQQQNRADLAIAQDAQQNAQRLALAERAQAADEQRRADEMAFREFALSQNLTADMAKLAQEKAKADAEARVQVIQFQGSQDLQADLARGVPFEQAIQVHLPKITFGSPTALTGYANTLNRTKTQEEIALEKSNQQFMMRDLIEQGLDRRQAIAEQGRSDRSEKDRLLKTQLAQQAAGRLTGKLSQSEVEAMRRKMKLVEENELDVPTALRQISEIESEYNQIASNRGNPARTQQSSKRVNVIDPDGKLVSVPESQLEEALDQGYTRQ